MDPTEPDDAPPPGDRCIGLETLDRLRRHDEPADLADRTRLDAAAEHLARCSACRDRLDELRETQEFIAEFTVARRYASISTPDRNDGVALRDDFPGRGIALHARKAGWRTGDCGAKG